MEVHHHPHVEKKSFKEYLLEGLMIFLAVSMGFIAENIRETFAHRGKEHTMMKMLVQDLAFDSVKDNRTILLQTKKLSGLDSLRQMIYAVSENKLPDSLLRRMYFLRRMYGGNLYDFSPTERTLSQFDKTDAFNIIHNQLVSDTIVFYKEYNQLIIKQQNIYIEHQQKASNTSNSFFDASLLKNFVQRSDSTSFLSSDKICKLLINDKIQLNLYANELFSMRASLLTLINMLKDHKRHAISLIALIQKEYDLGRDLNNEQPIFDTSQ